MHDDVYLEDNYSGHKLPALLYFTLTKVSSKYSLASIRQLRLSKLGNNCSIKVFC